jgi:hypothetical protein
LDAARAEAQRMGAEAQAWRAQCEAAQAEADQLRGEVAAFRAAEADIESQLASFGITLAEAAALPAPAEDGASGHAGADLAALRDAFEKEKDPKKQRELYLQMRRVQAALN